MNAKEKNILFQFPQLDAALVKKFGSEIEPESFLDILGDMKHHTNFHAAGQLRKEIELFIEGFMAGNIELRERLEAAIKR